VLDPVRDDLDGLRAYAVSKRALELAGRDIETGVPIAAAQEVVDGPARPSTKRPSARLADYQRPARLEYPARFGHPLAEKASMPSRPVNEDYVPFLPADGRRPAERRAERRQGPLGAPRR